MNPARPAPAHTAPSVSTGSLCDDCAAKCCRYFALEIDEPETRADFEDLRWYLCHERCLLYVADETWYLHIESDCRYRGPDSRCLIYERRPAMCREHSTDDCEQAEPWAYDLKFTTLEELETYIAARFD